MYLNNETESNEIYSGHNLPKTKNGVYTINLNDKQSNGVLVFRCSLKKVKLCTLILLELSIFLKKY